MKGDHGGLSSQVHSRSRPTTRLEVSIELCGEVRLEVDGRRRERELPGRLGRILLGYLALHRRRAVTRDELIEALWPQGAPEDPGATLSTLLSALRRVLGPEVVQGRAELRLALPDGARLDVEQAAADLEHGRPEPALDVLERTLLPGFDAPWLLQRRRELEEERLAALELLARDALAAGAAHCAQAAAGRIVAAAPFRESGYALLMDAQAAHGNVAEALRTFERLRERMRDELGSVPSPELRAAHQRLLARADAPPAALPEPLARLAGRRFVGRAGVLETLRARRGQRRFVLLAGEPGIGKTSLAAAFAREVHERGDALVLYGRSDEDALAPYQPFAEMLGDDLARLVDGAERYRLFEAVASALARLGPLLVVCDDLQWADRPTLLLLRHLARAREPERLLVIGTYRDTELAPDAPLRELIADLRRERVLEEVALAGLDAGETASLLDGLPAETAHRLHALTNGNPLFLEELVRAGAEAVPAGIQEVLRRRVGRLPEPAHELLTLAAVAGQTFRLALLERHFAADTVAGVCDRALAAGLLTETAEPDVLAFAHALMRQTLYEELSGPRRVRLHQRVAETLAELRADPVELAHHYFRARHVAGPEPAIRHAREAARRAAASLAWEDEALQLERALEADELREPPDPADRAELLLALGEARTRGGHGAARPAFAEAATLARGRDPEQLARAAIGYAGRYYEAGVIDDELVALLRDALDALALEESEQRARLLARLAEAQHFAGDPAAALQLSQAALAGARALGDPEVLAAALAGRHVALLHVEHVDERLAIGRELLALADRARDPRREMQALQGRIFDRLCCGDVRGARQDRERLAALALELREPLFVHFAVGWAGAFAQIDGRLDVAERLALESYELRRQLQTRDAESVLAAQLFMIRRAQGRVAELRDAVVDVVERFPAMAAWRAGLPLVYAAAGDAAAGRRELDRCLEGVDEIPRDFFWLTALTTLSDATVRLRAAGPAERLYALLHPYAARWHQIGYAASDGPVARSLGILAAAAGDRTTAVGHLQDCVEVCEAAGAPAFAQRARADLASL